MINPVLISIDAVEELVEAIGWTCGPYEEQGDLSDYPWLEALRAAEKRILKEANLEKR
jgi:hypothetical protein